ncbi:MAG: hypothetical protein ACRD4K_01265, partial [Candidatus Acidiferrales bacterium]
MNPGRYLGAVLAMWIVRTLLNFAFYGKYMAGKYMAIAAAHPGLLKEGVAGYIVTDLFTCIVFVLLLAKVGNALGGGAKAGITLGLMIALLGPIGGALYGFFTFTFSTVSSTC